MNVDARHIEDDERARRDSLDVSRSFIVQAPAGSGKTELLIQRYLKLLSVVENPEEVIAITFTRKAAAEMQFRVLSALKLAHRGERPEQEHQRTTQALAQAALSRDAEHGWQLITNPRRLRIQTLDSLNALISRLQPISAPESASGTRIVTGAELKSLYRAAGLATLDWLTESDAMGVATREVLVHVDNNTWSYVSYLAQMLATRDQWLPFVGSGLLSDKDADALRLLFEENINHVVVDHLQKTAAAFAPELAINLESLRHYAAARLRDAGDLTNPIVACRSSANLPPPDPDAMTEWRGVSELLLTKAGGFRKKVDKRQGFPPGDSGEKAAMHELLAQLSEHGYTAGLLHAVRTLPPVQYSDDQWRVLRALFRLLPLAVTELKRLFAEQGVSDHNEVALTAGAALGTADNPGDVTLLLDYQVKHLLVDEMQDTSSAQYRMLESLMGGWETGDGRTLYCVGDPMQSIYRFRNAEVGQFLLARQHGVGGVKLEPLLLRRNFRSGQFLVDWFNTVFPEILAPDDEPSSGAVAYSDAVSVPHLAAIGECNVHPIFHSQSEEEAKQGCRVIEEIMNDHPEDNVAVLVRGRTQLPGLLAALRRARVDYRAIDIDRLTDLPEIIEVLALTRAAVHQGDRIAWLSLLRAPWIGLDWHDLHALVVNDAKSTVWEILRAGDRLEALSASGKAAVESAMSVLSKLVAPRRAMSLRQRVESCWLEFGGPGILSDQYAIANVYRYLDVLEKIERRGSLDDVAELESILDQERVSSDLNARLQIMTMHRAKGLEFEQVVLFGLGRLPGSSDRRVLSWYDVPDEHGRQRKVISPVGPRAELTRDPIHRFIELSEADKNRHEQARLLYVACTRARKSLHLVGHTTSNPDGEDYKPPSKRSLLHMLWPALEPQFAQAFSAGRQTPPDVPIEPWLNPVRRRFESDWILPPVDSPTGPLRTQPGVETEEKVEFYWVGAEARLAGTIVHRCLHAVADGRAPAEIEALPQYRPITRRWLKEMGVGDRMIEGISDRIETALRRIFDDEKGRWLLRGEGRAELALTGVVDGTVESVVLDRIRVDNDGTHWIIDYKTSSHEGGNLEGFLQAEIARYTPQLKKYKSIYTSFAGIEARCALYFPLLQTFLEVDV
ncbi:MAG: UvrD-helicase domain-containing protein [Woeseiaceae bacterium]